MVFGRYVAELRRIFDENKERCLPAEVARRGLQIKMHRSTLGHRGGLPPSGSGKL